MAFIDVDKNVIIDRISKSNDPKFIAMLRALVLDDINREAATTIEQYNEELDEPVEQFEGEGCFTHDEVVEMFRQLDDGDATAMMGIDKSVIVDRFTKSSDLKFVGMVRALVVHDINRDGATPIEECLQELAEAMARIEQVEFYTDEELEELFRDFDVT